MQLALKDDLPFVTVHAQYNGASIEIPDVLVDTGSASTVIAADRVAPIGLVPQPNDTLRTLQGIGGTEVVFTRQVERLTVGEQGVDVFEIEVGGLDYGFAINGILGMDFLTRTAAILDLGTFELRFPV